MTKSDLRSQQRSLLRKAVQDGSLDLWNQDLLSHLLPWIHTLPEPSVIALYGGLPDEPDLWLHLAPALIAAGHTPALFLTEPRSQTMQPFAVTESHHVARARLGYWEPAPSHTQPSSPIQPNIVLVPGLAFSPSTGARLGRGAGFYDRYLATPSGLLCQRIGISYDCQLVVSLPLEPHDVPVQRLCTESGWRDIPSPPHT